MSFWRGLLYGGFLFVCIWLYKLRAGILAVQSWASLGNKSFITILNNDFLDISRKQTGQKNGILTKDSQVLWLGKNSLMLYKQIKSMPGFFMQVKVVFSLQFVTHYSA